MNMTQEYLHAKAPGIHNFIVKDSPIRFMQVNYQEVEDHVKLLTAKEGELTEAIERLEAEGEVIQIFKNI